jgi:hypothetical protein
MYRIISVLAILALVVACSSTNNEPQLPRNPENITESQVEQALIRAFDSNSGSTTPVVMPDVPETIPADGDLLFARYYALMRHSDMNDEFAMFYIDVADEGIARIREQFLLYTDKTLDDWFDMTWLERHIYYRTYVRIIELDYSERFERYFASEQLFLDNTVSTIGYRQNFDDETFDAYIELMLWQYHYYINNGVPYNFLDGFDG